MDEEDRFEFHTVHFLIALRKPNLHASRRKARTRLRSIELAKKTLTWYEASLRRLARKNE
jgi:hypothetical protein